MSWQVKGGGKSFLEKAVAGAVVSALGLVDYGKG
jgi:hypothetical protein